MADWNFADAKWKTGEQRWNTTLNLAQEGKEKKPVTPPRSTRLPSWDWYVPMGRWENPDGAPLPRPHERQRASLRGRTGLSSSSSFDLKRQYLKATALSAPRLMSLEKVASVANLGSCMASCTATQQKERKFYLPGAHCISQRRRRYTAIPPSGTESVSYRARILNEMIRSRRLGSS